MDTGHEQMATRKALVGLTMDNSDKKNRYGSARLQFYSVRKEILTLRKKGMGIKAIHKILTENKKVSMHYKTFWIYVDMFENPEKYHRKKRRLPMYLGNIDDIKQGDDNE